MENNEKTPYFILESQKLRQNFQEFDSLCKKHFKNYQVAYSVKTNSLREAVDVLNDEASGFEVASFNELNLVKNFKAIKVFNSPCKTASDLKEAIKQKAIINVDSLGELAKLEKLVAREVGVRIAFQDSKFGIEASKIDEVIKNTKNKGIKIVAFSFHPGTQT